MLRPSPWNFSAIIQQCRNEKVCQRALQVHVYLKRSGLRAPKNDSSSTRKESGSVVFDIPRSIDGAGRGRELFWNSCITSLIKSGETRKALDVYENMSKEISPRISPRTFGALLKSCARTGDIETGIQLHADVSKRELLEHDVFIGSALVDMYAKCACLPKAQEVFDMLRIHDVVSWTALIRGYVETANSVYGLHCFEQMQHEGVLPDEVTYSCALKGCSNNGGGTEKGRELHLEVTKKGLENDMFIGNTLIDMYAKSGAFSDACQVFRKLSARDVVSWNALISGYAENDCGEEALECYKKMKICGVLPEAATFVSCMKACTSIGSTSIAKEIHVDISIRGLKDNPFVGSAMVDMYTKFGLLTKAQGVFDELLERNVVSWTALITAYAEHGVFRTAINCLELMQQEGISAVAATFLSILRACGVRGVLADGWKLHGDITKLGLEKDLVIGSTLVDMYTKQASHQEAQRVFDILPVHDVVSWSVLISGYAQLGESEWVFRAFDRMIGGGVKPSVVTFGSVLYVCNHAGLVDEGQMYFESMSKEYGLSPSFEHHVCVADLLGRAGEVEKALVMIQKMPFHPGTSSWLSVMTACRKWGNPEMARQAFGNLLCLDTTDASAYVCMSNICSGSRPP